MPTNSNTPATAKRPADRKPAKKTATKPSTNGRGSAQLPDTVEFTYDGITYEITPGAFDDLEVFEALEATRNLEATRLVLGDEQWTRYKESARDPHTGRVSLSGAEDFLNQLMEAARAGN